jgi:glutathione synthase
MHQAARYFGSSAGFDIEDFAVNETRAGVAEGLAAAHKAYGVEGSVLVFPRICGVSLMMDSRAQVLFIVQPGERNVFDQRGLEYELLERYVKFLLIQLFLIFCQTRHSRRPTDVRGAYRQHPAQIINQKALSYSLPQ